jgi:hypothetical protein
MPETTEEMTRIPVRARHPQAQIGKGRRPHRNQHIGPQACGALAPLPFEPDQHAQHEGGGKTDETGEPSHQIDIEKRRDSRGIGKGMGRHRHARPVAARSPIVNTQVQAGTTGNAPFYRLAHPDGRPARRTA